MLFPARPIVANLLDVNINPVHDDALVIPA